MAPPIPITNRAAAERYRQQQILARDVDIKRLLIAQQACPDDVLGKAFASPAGVVPPIINVDVAAAVQSLTITQLACTVNDFAQGYNNQAAISTPGGAGANWNYVGGFPQWECALTNAGGNTDYLVLKNFGFTLPPAAVVKYFEIRIYRKSDNFNDVYDLGAYITLDGVNPSGTSQPNTFVWPKSTPGGFYGGSFAGTWGNTGLTGADVNASTFGVMFAGTCGPSPLPLAPPLLMCNQCDFAVWY